MTFENILCNLFVLTLIVSAFVMRNVVPSGPGPLRHAE